MDLDAQGGALQLSLPDFSTSWENAGVLSKSLDAEWKGELADLRREVVLLRDGVRSLSVQCTDQQTEVLEVVDEKLQQELENHGRRTVEFRTAMLEKSGVREEIAARVVKSETASRAAITALEERLLQDLSLRQAKLEAGFRSSLASLDTRLSDEAAKTTAELRRNLASQSELVRLELSNLEMSGDRKMEEQRKTSGAVRGDEILAEVEERLRAAEHAQRASATALEDEFRREVASVSAEQHRSSAALRSLVEEQRQQLGAAQERASDARRSGDDVLTARLEVLERRDAKHDGAGTPSLPGTPRGGAGTPYTPSTPAQTLREVPCFAPAHLSAQSPLALEDVEGRMRVELELQQHIVEQRLLERTRGLEEKLAKETARVNEQQEELQLMLQALEDTLRGVPSGNGADLMATAAERRGIVSVGLDSIQKIRRQHSSGVDSPSAVSTAPSAEVELELGTLKTSVDRLARDTKEMALDVKRLHTAALSEKNDRLDNQSRVQTSQENFERRMSAQVSEVERVAKELRVVAMDAKASDQKLSSAVASERSARAVTELRMSTRISEEVSALKALHEGQGKQIVQTAAQAEKSTVQSMLASKMEEEVRAKHGQLDAHRSRALDGPAGGQSPGAVLRGLSGDSSRPGPQQQSSRGPSCDSSRPGPPGAVLRGLSGDSRAGSDVRAAPRGSSPTRDRQELPVPHPSPKMSARAVQPALSGSFVSSAPSPAQRPPSPVQTPGRQAPTSRGHVSSGSVGGIQVPSSPGTSHIPCRTASLGRRAAPTPTSTVPSSSISGAPTSQRRTIGTPLSQQSRGISPIQRR